MLRFPCSRGPGHTLREPSAAQVFDKLNPNDGRGRHHQQPPEFLPLPLGEGRGEGSPGPSEAMARIVSPIPSVRAEKHSGRGARGQRSMPMLRALTGRSCLNGAPKARSEFCGRTPPASIAGCPKRSAGSRTVGRISFAFFSCASKKRGSPAGARPGLPTSTQRNASQPRGIKIHSYQRAPDKRHSPIPFKESTQPPTQGLSQTSTPPSTT